MDAATITTVINNINSLYSNLIAYTVGLILFVGAFVPTAISFFQNEQFKKEQEDIKKRISIEAEEKAKQLEISLNQTVQNALAKEIEKINKLGEELRNELEKETATAKAGAFHIQANNMVDRNWHDQALISCRHALGLYLIGLDERNARSVITIIESCLNKLNKKNFDNLPEIKESTQKIIDLLTEKNENGRYSIDLTNIKASLRNAEKRDPPKAATPTTPNA